jgi:hypothetical protein
VAPSHVLLNVHKTSRPKIIKLTPANLVAAYNPVDNGSDIVTRHQENDTADTLLALLIVGPGKLIAAVEESLSYRLKKGLSILIVGAAVILVLFVELRILFAR